MKSLIRNCIREVDKWCPSTRRLERIKKQGAKGQPTLRRRYIMTNLEEAERDFSRRSLEAPGQRKQRKQRKPMKKQRKLEAQEAQGCTEFSRRPQDPRRQRTQQKQRKLMKPGAKSYPTQTAKTNETWSPKLPMRPQEAPQQRKQRKQRKLIKKTTKTRCPGSSRMPRVPPEAIGISLPWGLLWHSANLGILELDGHPFFVVFH